MKPLFTKIASYQYSSEACIVKGRMEANGIEVFMADEYIIDAYPLMSNAIGGVKLLAKTHQLDAANRVLSEISYYSVDNKGERMICPKCNGDHVEMRTTIKDLKAFVVFLISPLLIPLLPLYVKYKFHCSSCKNEFAIK